MAKYSAKSKVSQPDQVNEPAVAYGGTAPTLTPPRRPGQIRELRNSLGVTQTQMQRLIGVSVRKLSAIETGSRTATMEDARRFQEMARLRQHLGEVIAPDAIGDWLTTPNDYFHGSSPIDVIERGEIDRVWRLIWRLADGVPLQ